MNKKRANWILGILIFVIIGSIFFIRSMSDLGNGDEKVVQCIAENSKLYVSKTCSHCAQQKLILGEGIKYINLVDCSDDSLKCSQEIGDETGRYVIPTWIINEEKYSGVRSIEQLKELTGC